MGIVVVRIYFELKHIRWWEYEVAKHLSRLDGKEKDELERDNQNELLKMLIGKWFTTKNMVVENKISPLKEIGLHIDGRIITASPFEISIVNTIAVG